MARNPLLLPTLVKVQKKRFYSKKRISIKKVGKWADRSFKQKLTPARVATIVGSIYFSSYNDRNRMSLARQYNFSYLFLERGQYGG
jgi:hypothetical protein